MHIYVQWTTLTPQDWTRYEINNDSDWRNLPTKPDPAPGIGPKDETTLDELPGWVFAINVQGIIFSGNDHYSVRYNQLENGLYVTTWNDDADDYTPTQYVAKEWGILFPAPDARFENKVNTRQRLVVWTNDPATRAQYQNGETTGGAITLRNWNAFKEPDAAMTRHGIWVTDPIAAAHQAAQTPHGWDEWVV